MILVSHPMWSTTQGSHHQGKSGKVRGIYFLLESQGISIFFVGSQGILIWLRCTKFCHIFLDTFWKAICLYVQKFSSLCSDFHAILIRFVPRGQGKSVKMTAKKSGKVRELNSSWPLGTLTTVQEYPAKPPDYRCYMICGYQSETDS